MITLLTAMPGGGKTAQAVAWIKEAVDSGRCVCVHGLDGLTLPHVRLDDATKWHEVVPDGALVVIDEVQSVWRPARSGAEIPPHIAELETHRHRGLDFILTTQHANLVHANVRRLVGRHVHLIDFGPIFGRKWWEWAEISDAGKAARASALVSRSYRLPKEVFQHYKSASVHVKPVRGVPRSVLVMAVALPLTVALCWFGYARVMARTKAPTPAQESRLPAVMGTSTSAAPTGSASLARPASGPVLPPVAAALPASGPVRLLGCISMRRHCECIDADGYSVEVDLQMCETGARRSGVAIAYVSPRDGPVGVVAGASVGSGGRVRPVLTDPMPQEGGVPSHSPLTGWDLREMRESLPSSPRR